VPVELVQVDIEVPTKHPCGNSLYVVDRDIHHLPEFVIDDLAADPTALLRSTFDLA
jgi:hypothetical protein